MFSRRQLFQRLGGVVAAAVGAKVLPAAKPAYVEFVVFQTEGAAIVHSSALALNEFTRATMREDGFYRKIVPPVLSGDLSC